LRTANQRMSKTGWIYLSIITIRSQD